MANSVFRVENGFEVGESSNATFTGAVTVNGAVTIANTLTVTGLANVATMNVVGQMIVGGNVTIGGNVVFTGSTVGNFVPDQDGRFLGNTVNRWSLIANSGSFANSVTMYGNVIPVGNTIALGNTTNRWILSANTGDFSGVLTSNNLTVTGVANLQANVTIGGTLSYTSINTSSVFVKLSVSGANLVLLASNSYLTNGGFTANTTQVLVDEFSSTDFSGARYTIRAFNGSNTAQTAMVDVMLVHDGSVTRQVEYGQVNTISTFITYTANVDTGILRLFANSNLSNTQIKLNRVLIA
jgi:hypothetical protein